jgi:hypothetical protein
MLPDMTLDRPARFSFSVARGLLQTRNKIMFGAIQTESRRPDPVFDPLDSAGAEEGGYVVYRLAHKTFRLHKAKARAPLEGKGITNPFTWLDEAICLRKGRPSLKRANPSIRPAALCKMLARRI